MDINIFELAARTRLRFVTSKGELSTEDVYRLPLSGAGITLDSIAIDLNTKLQSTPRSFVGNSSKDSDETELKFEIVKHIINVRKKEQEEAQNSVRKSQERKRIMEIINDKKDEKLKTMTIDELMDMVKTLD